MKGVQHQFYQLTKYENPEPDPKKPLLVEGDKGLPTGAGAVLCLLHMKFCITILFYYPLCCIWVKKLFSSFCIWAKK